MSLLCLGLTVEDDAVPGDSSGVETSLACSGNERLPGT